jgi:hypothetical protein
MDREREKRKRWMDIENTRQWKRKGGRDGKTEEEKQTEIKRWKRKDTKRDIPSSFILCFI